MFSRDAAEIPESGICLCCHHFEGKSSSTAMFKEQRLMLSGRKTDAARNTGVFASSLAELDTKASAVCKKYPAAAMTAATFLILAIHCLLQIW
jgi:hypothetical protein